MFKQKCYCLFINSICLYFVYTSYNFNSVITQFELKLVDQFICLGSNISSIEGNFNICIGKAWTSVNRLLTIWKSDLSDEIKWEFLQAIAISVLLLYN